MVQPQAPILLGVRCHEAHCGIGVCWRCCTPCPQGTLPWALQAKYTGQNVFVSGRGQALCLADTIGGGGVARHAPAALLLYYPDPP